MLDLPDSPILDKHSLVGGCTRLKLPVDAGRLQAELHALPAELWGSRGGRVGVHNAAEAIFLRGYAPAEGDKPIDDRPTLDLLPGTRALIEKQIPGQPMRCLLARLPAGGVIAPHIDRAPYFHKTVRLHIPIVSNAQAWMFCAGQFYRMQAGEVWALNNVAVHAVLNAHPTLSRTHLICDLLPDAELLELLRQGERNLGAVDPALEQEIAQRAEIQNRAAAPLP